MFFHYQVGCLVDYRAPKSYMLAGSPDLQLVLDPLAVLLMTTDYNYPQTHGLQSIALPFFKFFELEWSSELKVFAK